jgi:MFS family permease
MIVHASQFIGPSIGGFLVAVIDPGWTFIINGLSFAPMIGCLAMMRFIRIRKTHQDGKLLRMAFDGMKYVLTHREIRFALVLYGVTNALGYAAISIMPVVAAQVFHGIPEALGFLISASALGATIGAIVSAAHRGSPRVLVITGFLLMGISFLGFGFMDKLLPGMVWLFFSGFGFTITGPILHALIQNMTQESMRGRAMGIIVFSIFTGVTIGNLVIGKGTDLFGAPFAIKVNGILLLLVAVLIVMFRKNIPEHQQH